MADRRITVHRARQIKRQWGLEITVVQTATHCGKILRRQQGTKGGFQLHCKEESHYLVSGRLLLRTVGPEGAVLEQVVEPGMAWTVPPFTVHQEEALAESVVFEVSDPTTQDRYGIMPDPGGLPSMTDAQAIAILHGLRDRLRRRSEECQDLARLVESVGLAAVAQSGR